MALVAVRSEVGLLVVMVKHQGQWLRPTCEMRLWKKCHSLLLELLARAVEKHEIDVRDTKLRK